MKYFHPTWKGYESWNDFKLKSVRTLSGFKDTIISVSLLNMIASEVLRKITLNASFVFLLVLYCETKRNDLDTASCKAQQRDKKTCCMLYVLLYLLLFDKSPDKCLGFFFKFHRHLKPGLSTFFLHSFFNCIFTIIFLRMSKDLVQPSLSFYNFSI